MNVILKFLRDILEIPPKVLELSGKFIWNFRMHVLINSLIWTHSYNSPTHWLYILPWKRFSSLHSPPHNCSDIGITLLSAFQKKKILGSHNIWPPFKPKGVICFVYCNWKTEPTKWRFLLLCILSIYKLRPEKNLRAQFIYLFVSN